MGKSALLSKFRSWWEWRHLAYISGFPVLLFSLFSFWVSPSFLNVALIISSSLSMIGARFRISSLVFLPYIVSLGVFIRIQNLALLKYRYPLALDPYYFLRLARTYVETGSFPHIDMLRSAPLGRPSGKDFFVLTIVWTYRALSAVFPGITLELADILHPVIYFAFGVAAFYLLARRAFNTATAVVASLLLSVLPSYLYRTMAGFSDHESIAMMFMFLSFWAFLSVAGGSRRHLFWSALSGVFAGFVYLSWGGGSKLLLTIIAFYALVVFTLGLLNLQKSVSLLVFSLSFLAVPALFFADISKVFPLVKSIYFLPVLFFALYGVFLHFIVPKLSFLRRFGRVPLHLSASALLALLAFALGSLVIGFSHVLRFIQKLFYSVFIPLGTGRVTLTVAENKVPFLRDWLGQFGFFFWVFLAGGIYLSYSLSRPLSRARKSSAAWLFPLFASVLVLSFLLANKDPYSLLNGTSIYSFAFFVSGLLVSFGILAYLSFLSVRHRISLSKLDGKMIFVLAWWLAMMLSARGAVRVFIVLVPPAVLVASRLIAFLLERAVSVRDIPGRVFFFVMAFLLFVPVALPAYSSSLVQARYTGPGFNQQWQLATGWIKQNTPPGSVFAHWWDYGYWVQAEGNRPTILDGGNPITYWNHLLGRHVLAGKSYREALEFLYAHNASYLLIISDEIGKYSAYSSIGSNEEFDIFSWISTFVMNPKKTEREGSTAYYYFQGATALDEPFNYSGTVFDKNSLIVGFKIPVENDDDPRAMKVLQPLAIVVSNGKTTEVPVQCIYDDGMKEFDDYGIGGCVRIFPRIIDGRFQQENGALLWVSRRGFSALWTKLFLFNEQNPYFELVYDDSQYYRLAYYNGRTLGPLKIWKIRYPENFTINDSLRDLYLAHTTPEWERLNEENRFKSPLLKR